MRTIDDALVCLVVEAGKVNPGEHPSCDSRMAMSVQTPGEAGRYPSGVGLHNGYRWADAGPHPTKAPHLPRWGRARPPEWFQIFFVRGVTFFFLPLFRFSGCVLLSPVSVPFSFALI